MKQLLFLLLLTPLLTTCKKDPPIDYERYPNRVTCKVNGKHWQPSDNGGWIQHNFFSISYTPSVNLFTVNVKKIENDETLSISLRNFKAGPHIIKFPNRAWWRDFKKPGLCYYYETDSTLMNNFVVQEIDSTHNIVKARFELHLVNPCGERIDISDGWIDAKLRIL